ncbi:MAG: zinc metalloprotease [Bacteroidetes bacterium]|jgi:hypothetical protein|nr:zinc metalloprotease [Bacteroidota bacterium]
MKKTFLLIGSSVLFAIGCTKTSLNDKIASSQDAEDGVEVPITHRICGTPEVLQRQLQEDPTLADRMAAIENFTSRFEQMAQNPSANRLVNGVIEIPVVVNVLYKTAAQNISDAQINSQITVLNNDYQALNADYSQTPSLFQSLRSGNTNIRFVLDKINRKSTTKSSWGTNDAMKKAANGITPTSPTTKLNIWVCNLSGGILGYAQFPGGSSATDGVVIDDNAFGTTGTVSSPYNKGRTATHEIGHWLNLRHIWGDASCGNDLVNDTPTQQTSNFGCPSFPHKTCSNNGDMSMNYMDYTDDACMYMFTLGQKTRMQAVFASGGPRNSFAQP